MPIINNTDRAVQAAKPVNGKQTEYTIRGVKGLKLHVQPSGHHRWYFHYWTTEREGDQAKRKHKALPLGFADTDARTRDATTMTREQASKAAREAQYRLDQGDDPVAERHGERGKRKQGASVSTFHELVETGLTKQGGPKQKTAKQ